MEQATDAVAAERMRIARELHDIVAHALTVTVLQAAGARHVLDVDPERARRALVAIEKIGKHASEELRRTLSELRVPRRENLESVVDAARSAGVRVQVETTGVPRHLAPQVGLTVHRVVQESLTNVIKHAGREARATVRLAWSCSSLRVDVIDDGGSAPSRIGTPTGSGYGLLGMAERVAAVGGRTRAGHLPGGGFHVMCLLPLESERIP